MGIKDLFNSPDKSLVYSDYETQKEAFESVESMDNAEQVNTTLRTYVPSVDYSNPVFFARFGSARLYYQAALDNIINYYPYDGSKAEKNKFYNDLLEIEKYVFDSLYPRSTGYITFAADEWGTATSMTDGWGSPTDEEYITLYGGPGTGSAGTSLVAQSPNPYSNAFNYGNIYDENIYQTAGLPDDYGKGTRLSNLRANFDDGVTVEFWLKTGSLDPLLTEKQAVFDLWNNELSSSTDYRRGIVYVENTANPFKVVLGEGTTETTFSLGTLPASSLSDWKHYAITLANTGSNFNINLYVNGLLDDTQTVPFNLSEGNASKNMMGRLGALLTTPSGNIFHGVDLDGAGKLSGSIDEFRYWKVARTQKQIAENYFVNVGGGANTDISNADLGVYYKFNEGITGVASTDSIVLDYAGRICNGVWTGYGSSARSTSSAIVEADAAIKEYKEPIVRTNNPAYSTLRAELINKGRDHDLNNNSAFINYSPAWVIEEHENSTDSNNLQIISHIMGAYFDKLYNLIGDVPKLKHFNYPSASAKPLPFAMHLPMSLGTFVPDLFVDATILEALENRTESELFEGNLSDAKNLIYQNLYNNLTNIYKSKGTEKSIRNVLRCFNIDDSLVRFKTYSRNNVYELKDNLRQITQPNTRLNLNNVNNYSAVVYQRKDNSNLNSSGYISGTFGSLIEGREDPYGLTAEAEVIFPKYFNEIDRLSRNFVSASIFGMHTVDGASAASREGTDTTLISNDYANFQVYAVRDALYSKNARFVISASSPYPFSGELSSSTFFDVYDDNRWNFSVRLKPAVPGVTTLVSGSFTQDYDIVFRGVNEILGVINKSFEVSASITNTPATRFLESPKRIYCGARKQNITGLLLQKSDIYVSNIKYWPTYLDNNTLNLHLQDINNSGISKGYRNISGLDSNNGNFDLLNRDMLALEWNFNNVTASNVGGTFVVQDNSSGSAQTRDNFSWIGNIVGYQHSGYGQDFVASSADVVNKDIENSFKFIDPEETIASDMVQILSEDDRLFKIVETVPNYVFTIEKSMYQAISEEMMTFFAGVIDFHNLIGDPVNRYRDRYKNLEKLREIFFKRVTQVSDVEKFIKYYKWFDDALSTILAQLMPASGDFIPDVLNTVESHVLERNKYATKFPTLEFKYVDPSTPLSSGDHFYPGFLGGSTCTNSPRAIPQFIFPFGRDARCEIARRRLLLVIPLLIPKERYIERLSNSSPHLSQSKTIVSTLEDPHGPEEALGLFSLYL